MAAVGTVGRSQPPVDCGVGLCGLGCLGSMAYLTWARAASRRLFDRLRGFELNCAVSNCATSNCVGLEPRGLEPRGLRLCLRWAQWVVERLGLCGRGLCWARAQRPRVARPQVATRRLCGRLGLCGVGSKVPGPMRS
jgi:hypothetical protein